METHHLSVDEWDELLVGSVSERARVHLDGCPECQSVVDRLTRDAMPRSARTGRRANYFVPAIAAGGVAAIAGAVAIVYGAAYVHSTQREAEMGARVLSLEAQASASDPASAAILPPAGKADNSAAAGAGHAMNAGGGPGVVMAGTTPGTLPVPFSLVE